MPDSDREQIQNHLARYCFTVDQGTADQIAGLFWDDARLDFNGIFTDSEAIRDCYVEWIRKARDPVEGLRHLIYVPLIDIDEDSALTETYVDADCHARRSGRAIQLRSLYRDRLTKRHGEWRFSDRHIVAMPSLQGSPPK